MMGVRFVNVVQDELAYILNVLMNNLIEEFTKPNCKLSKSMRIALLTVGLAASTNNLSESEVTPFAYRERLNAALNSLCEKKRGVGKKNDNDESL